ncbi:MAG: HD domain-containing protein [Candidatus Levybacteria bacterium]|nr:HD domain-containing protein [Candidatus Levybacteria bacterium]
MKSDKRIDFEKIFTPQGLLGDVSKNPNLDFLMNIFKIPRIYGVSGFGQWNVGQHTMAVAFLALYWSKFNNYPQEKRDRLVTLGLVHDAHEAVIGDILPFFKTTEVKEAIEKIQNDILNAFSITEDETLKEELKLIDMISFLYEISQSSPQGLYSAKKQLLKEIYKRQKEIIFEYTRKSKIEEKKVRSFLKKMSL